MRVRRGTSLVSLIGVLSLVAVGALGVEPAGAARPPVQGSIACSLAGTTTFVKPPLGYGGGRGNSYRPGPNARSKITIAGALTACTGTQTGGNPRHPGPIVRGELSAKGRANTGYRCSNLTDGGATFNNARIKWFDATDQLLGITKGTAGLSVSGLGWGIQSWWAAYTGQPLPPGAPTPVAPGVITFALAGSGAATSSAFPGKAIAITTVVDETIDSWPWPCSHDIPPWPQGIGQFAMTGVQGPSSITIS